MAATPVIDQRTAQEIADRIRAAIPLYAPEWNIARDTGNGQALVKIFSEMAEAVLKRLNRVPEKHFVEFLRVLGIDLLPAQSGRAPVTFVPVKGLAGGAYVPAGTQLAAGQTDLHPPLVFETERAFVASGAMLAETYCVDPARDAIYGCSDRIRSGREVALFTDDQNLQRHMLYIGHETALNLKSPSQIDLLFQVVQGDIDLAQDAVWEYWADNENSPHAFLATPLPGTGIRLQKTEGDIEIGKTKVFMRESRWIRCTFKRAGPIVVKNARIDVQPQMTDISPDGLFANALPLNPQGEFDPFGMYPRLFDALFIASSEVFSKKGAAVTIAFTLATGNVPKPSADLAFAWEYWNGITWQPLAVADNLNKFVPLSADSAVSVSFTCPADFKSLNVNGATSLWVRVRIARGDFGKDEFTKSGQIWSVQKNYAPPRCASIAVRYAFPSGEGRGFIPERVVSYNNLDYEDLSGAAADGEDLYLAKPLPDGRPAFYLGFDRAFQIGNNSLFFSVVEDPVSGAQPGFTWSYWQETTDLREGMRERDKAVVFDSTKVPAGAELLFEEGERSASATVLSCAPDGSITLVRPLNGRFTVNARISRRSALEVTDSTMNLTRRGCLEFLAPSGHSKTRLFGKTCFWLMGRMGAMTSQVGPIVVERILPDTMWAQQAETIRNALLGSGNGERNQKLSLPKTPVMSAEIWIREDSSLSEEERESFPSEDIQAIKEAGGTVTGFWIRWKEVRDFNESRQDSRHWILDNQVGIVQFGDGEHGKIPPAGRDNIRFSYKAGGGAVGNVSAGEINVLKSSVAGLDKVVNHLAAEGGADAESLQGVFERGPHLVKHRDRAVSEEDFERISKAAASCIARTKCFVDGSRITVFVVPRSEDRRPRPSLELKNLVLRSLLERRPNVISSDMIRVSDPPYREIGVTAEIRPVSMELAAPLEKALVRELEKYFHPLTGGEGTGWEFGRGAHISDVYSLLEGIDGVDHVASLRLNDPILLFYWDEVSGGSSGERLLRYLNRVSGLEWVWGARVEKESPRLIRIIAGSKYFTLTADALGTRVEVALNDVFFGVLPMKGEQGRPAVYQEPSSIDVGGFETVCSGTHRVTVRMGS